MAEVFYGEQACDAIVASTGAACTNGAYYAVDGKHLCGVHASKAGKRKPLPKNPNAKKQKHDRLAAHNCELATQQQSRQAKGIAGLIQCQKMHMMAEVPLAPGYLNVFPNNKHQNRQDGFGCASLSPMRLGPVDHKQPGLPQALSIENYHQFNKLWPSEIDGAKNPTPAFYATQIAGYNDPVPHRHKEQRSPVAGALTKNEPLFSVHKAHDGTELRYTYVQSRYFYCKAYELLATRTKDFRTLCDKLAAGCNLVVCGYDAYPIDAARTRLQDYMDASRPFGHELVLYCLLTMRNSPETYPWNAYKLANPALYENVMV
jgi:hypothetical protein